MKNDFKGVQAANWSEKPELARALARALAAQGKVAYWRSEWPPRSQAPGDNRAAPRARTRLRSAKLLTPGRQLICECRIQNRSRTGLRLIMERNAPLPPRFYVFDDETQTPSHATVAWRRGSTVGIRFCSREPAPSLTPSEIYALTHRYYAVPDR